MERYYHCPTCGTPFRWKALFNGNVIATEFSPERILLVHQGFADGLTRDAIASLANVSYFSLNYIRQLKPLLTADQRAQLQEDGLL